MLQQRRAAALEVANKLFEAEDALDTALAAVGGRGVTMPAAPQGAKQ